MRIRALSITPLVLFAFAVTGCEFSGSIDVGKKVSSSELEKQVTKKLQSKLPPDSVSCPDGLKGKVGAEAKCTVIANQLRYTATVTATKVKGSTVSFDLKMPPPATLPKTALESQVAKLLAAKAPGGIDSVTCQDELVGVVGKTANCEVQPKSGDAADFTVTVTSATFTNIGFNITPAN